MLHNIAHHQTEVRRYKDTEELRLRVDWELEPTASDHTTLLKIDLFLANPGRVTGPRVTDASDGGIQSEKLILTAT